MLAELWEKAKSLLSRFLSPDEPLSGQSDEERLQRGADMAPEEEEVLGTPDAPLPFPTDAEGQPDDSQVVPGLTYFSPDSPSSREPVSPDAPRLGDPEHPLPMPMDDEGNIFEGQMRPGITYAIPESTPVPPPPEPEEARWKSFLEERAQETEESIAARVQPMPHMGAAVDRRIGQLNEEEGPISRKVRIPPEMEGREMGPPPAGFQVTGPQQEMPSTPAERSGGEKPINERQGDEMLQVLKDIAAKLDELNEAQGEIANTLSAMTSALASAGGVVP